jgi:hypothetical protein
MPIPSSLPHVDEHRTSVEADLAATWAALERVLEGSFGSAATGRAARLLGCAETAASGPRPLATGSTIPGFRVDLADPARTLALAGAHRFSNYALIFRLEPEGDRRATLRAETRADFPGIKGSAYQALVIGTRGHVLVTRRLLDAAKRKAERKAAAG